MTMHSNLIEKSNTGNYSSCTITTTHAVYNAFTIATAMARASKTSPKSKTSEHARRRLITLSQNGGGGGGGVLDGKATWCIVLELR